MYTVWCIVAESAVTVLTFFGKAFIMVGARSGYETF